jgi:hypothetical protein
VVGDEDIKGLGDGIFETDGVEGIVETDGVEVVETDGGGVVETDGCVEGVGDNSASGIRRPPLNTKSTEVTVAPAVTVSQVKVILFAAVVI